MSLLFEQLNFGPETELDPLMKKYSYVNTLSSSGFVVVHGDFIDSTSGVAVVGSVLGDNVSFGPDALYKTTSVLYNNVVTTSESGFVVFYLDDDGGAGQAKVGQVSGTTITFPGSEYTHISVGHIELKSTLLSPDKIVIVLKDQGSNQYGLARVCEVSGTTLTFGSYASFLSTNNNVRSISIDTIDASGFVLGYNDKGGTSFGIRGYVRICNVSGTEITLGDPEIVATGDVYRVDVSMLDSTKFVLTLEANSTIYSKIGTIDGDTVTYGDEVEFLGDHGSSHNLQPRATTLSATKFVIVCFDTADSNHGKAKLGTVDGTTITFGDEFKFNSASTLRSLVETLDEFKFIVVYEDVADSSKGMARVGNMATYVATSGDLFIEGHKNIETSGNLFTEGVYIVSVSGDFYTQGKEIVGNSTELYTISIGIDVASGSLFIQGNSSPITASSDLWIHGPEFASGSIFLYIYPDPPDLYNSTSLYMKVPEPASVSGNLFIVGIETPQASGNLFIRGMVKLSGAQAPPLFIRGYDVTSVSVNLFMSVPEIVSGSINLYIYPDPPDIYDITSLYIHGPELSIASGNLFVGGVTNLTSSINLFLNAGTIPTVEVLATPIDWLIRSSDYNPQIIGTIDDVTTVSIQVWNVTDGVNISLPIGSSDCYQIGDTGRWAWSTTYLPTPMIQRQQYFYVMTGDNEETFSGQFFLEVPERSKWFHPVDRNDYLKSI